MIFLEVVWGGLLQLSLCCNWCVKNFSAATCYLIDIPGRGGGGGEGVGVVYSSSALAVTSI